MFRMGKGTPSRPAWAANLGAMIDGRVLCSACCDRCRAWKEVDLEQLAQAKGRDYSLWGKRTRCRITPGCDGFNRFYCNGRGRLEPMRHD